VPYNENWVHYRYSMAIAIVDPSSGSISGYRYIDYGGMPNFWLAGDSHNGKMYFSYTKTPDKFSSEIFFAKYGESTDNMGPATFGSMVYPYNSNNATKVVYVDLVRVKSLTLNAIVSDVESGNSNIAGAEFFIDTPGTDGSGIALAAKDGAFDSPLEEVGIVIDPFALSRGYHRIYVHGQDSAGNWGAYDYIDVYIFASRFKVYGWVNDSSGSPLENIAVNVTNENTGENDIVYTNSQGYYEYYIDQFPHAYSIGDEISVYADDGTYYDVNSTTVASAPGEAKLNLKLTTAIPEFSDMLLLLLPLIGILLLRRRKRH